MFRAPTTWGTLSRSPDRQLRGSTHETSNHGYRGHPSLDGL